MISSTDIDWQGETESLAWMLQLVKSTSLVDRCLRTRKSIAWQYLLRQLVLLTSRPHRLNLLTYKLAIVLRSCIWTRTMCQWMKARLPVTCKSLSCAIKEARLLLTSHPVQLRCVCCDLNIGVMVHFRLLEIVPISSVNVVFLCFLILTLSLSSLCFSPSFPCPFPAKWRLPENHL